MRVGSNGITVAQLTKYLADAGMDANTEIIGQELNVMEIYKEDIIMRKNFEAMYELGRGYNLYIVAVEDRDNRYTVELDRGDRVVGGLSTGCIGMKSANYWMDYNKQVIERLIFIMDGIDMAYHNKMCYSNNLLMDTPKEGYCEEWHKENNELKMLHKWFKDIVDGLSESKKQQIIDEFSEYYDK